MKETAIVALDINSEDPNFESYNKKSADEKINFIANRIEKICEELNKKEPDSQWIVAWREYGITEADSKFISNESKKLLKEKMTALTEKFPKLTILSGTVATNKYVNEEKYQTKVSSLEQQYKKSEWIDQEETKKEKKEEGTSDPQFSLHRDLIKKKYKKASEGTNIVRNTSYIFSSGKCIARHDKTSPYYETSDSTEWHKRLNPFKRYKTMVKNTLFQAGNKQENPSHIVLSSGDVLGLELCREHFLGVLKKNNQEQLIKTDFHFVLGYQIEVQLDKIQADYFVLLDNTIKPQLIIAKDLNEAELHQLPVRLYQNDLLTDVNNLNLELQGPLTPLSMNAKEINSLFDKIEEKIVAQYSEEQKFKFEDIKIEFIRNISMGTLKTSIFKLQLQLGVLINELDEIKTSVQIKETIDNLISVLSKTHGSLCPNENIPVIPENKIPMPQKVK